MSCSSQHSTILFCPKCPNKKTLTCQFCNGTQLKAELIKERLEVKAKDRRRNFKQEIVHVFVFNNGLVTTTDQKDDVMLQFTGKQETKLKSIKQRIDKQKPCKITWHSERCMKEEVYV